MDETRDQAMARLLTSMEHDEHGVGHLETIVRKVHRMRNDRDGNPRFRLVTEHGELVTAKSSQGGLEVNETWEDTRVAVRLKGGEVIGVRAVTD